MSLFAKDPRILVVDDDRDIVDSLVAYLNKLDYSASGAYNGQEALEAFQADPHKFSLVITDMTMPNMTGDILTRELLKIRPDLPVILSTGFSEQINEQKAKSIGIKAFLMKSLF